MIKDLLLANDFVIFLPEIFFNLSIIVLIFLGVSFGKAVKTLGKRPVEILGYNGLFVILGTILLYLNQTEVSGSFFMYQVVKNEYTQFLAIFILVLMFCSFLFSFEYFRKDTINDFEFILLYFLAVSGILVLNTANDFLILYLGIELLSLSLYVLATFKQNSFFSTEAGLKYFVLGAFASGLYLFGVVLIYGFTGITNFTDLMYFLSFSQVEDSIFIIVGVLCVFSAFCFKVGLAPFHMWLPDVYMGAPTVVTGFFSVVPKVVIFSIMIKLSSEVLLTIFDSYQFFLICLGVCSIVVGSLGALYQKNIKRFFAFSAIGHSGFIMLGIATGGLSGILGSMVYIIIYSLLGINLFSILLSLWRQTNYSFVWLIGNLNTLYLSNKGLAVSFSFLLFSMAGIPPLVGFFSKLFILYPLIASGAYIVSILVILMSVVSAAYYIKLVRVMLFSSERKFTFLFPVENELAYLISYTTLLGLFFFQYSGIFINYLHNIILFFYF